jgi:hypothetical protein
MSERNRAEKPKDYLRQEPQWQRKNKPFSPLVGCAVFVGCLVWMGLATLCFKGVFGRTFVTSEPSPSPSLKPSPSPQTDAVYALEGYTFPHGVTMAEARKMIAEDKKRKQEDQEAEQHQQKEEKRHAEEEYEQNGLVLLNRTLKVKQGRYGVPVITGIMVNRTGHTLSYAQISFNIYDTTGAQVESVHDNVNYLEARGQWRFSAGPVPEGRFRYKIADIKGW